MVVLLIQAMRFFIEIEYYFFVENAVGNGIDCGTEYFVESDADSGAQDCSIVLQVLRGYFDSSAMLQFGL